MATVIAGMTISLDGFVEDVNGSAGALYPDLEAEDIREALLFAAEAVRERALPLAAGE